MSQIVSDCPCEGHSDFVWELRKSQKNLCPPNFSGYYAWLRLPVISRSRPVCPTFLLSWSQASRQLSLLSRRQSHCHIFQRPSYPVFKGTRLLSFLVVQLQSQSNSRESNSWTATKLGLSERGPRMYHHHQSCENGNFESPSRGPRHLNYDCLVNGEDRAWTSVYCGSRKMSRVVAHVRSTSPRWTFQKRPESWIRCIALVWSI